MCWRCVADNQAVGELVSRVRSCVHPHRLEVAGGANGECICSRGERRGALARSGEKNERGEVEVWSGKQVNVTCACIELKGMRCDHLSI
jgi:hypothetical protein